MATTTFTATPTSSSTSSTRSRTRSFWTTGLVSGAAAAAVNLGIAGVADATDHPLRVSGEQIPLGGFPQMTLIGALVGIVLALVLRRRATEPRRTFVRTTAVLTALSCIPSVAMGLGDGVGNTAALVATHVVAAVIIVGALGADRHPRWEV